MEAEFSYDKILTVTIDDTDYSGEICAKGKGYYQHGRMYMPNGDPGYPDEEEFEIESFDVLTLVNDETEEDFLNRYKTDKDFRSKIDSAIEDSLYIAYENGEWGCTDEEDC